jgi:galactitol-specific phosphotransferase system IIB component
MTDRDGTQRTITLTNGNYTASSLASHLKDTINTVSTDVYDVSFSVTTGKITITNPSGNFSITFGTNTINSIAHVLGFNNTNKTGSSSYTGDNVVRLNTKYYKIYTNILDNNTYTANETSTCIAIVPNNVNFGDLICYSPHLAKSFKVNSSEIASLDLYVKDDQNNIVELNGVDWSMNLVVNTE